MLQPPDVNDPFVSDDERAEWIVRLLTLDRELQRWLLAAAEADRGLEPEYRALLLTQPMQPGDSPELRVKRWASVFREEIDTIHDARSRVVHNIRTSDADIRGATWLAAHLLAMLRGADNS
jgi:hypothetical protein